MIAKRESDDGADEEVWDDEGGAGEPEEQSTDAQSTDEQSTDAQSPDAQSTDEQSTEQVDRARRWTDERAEHWHGAKSSDATQHRADEE
jgi:hypothetical protein